MPLLNKRLLLRALTIHRPRDARLLARGMYWFLRSKISGAPVLKYMDVALDYRCNMRCEHCFASRLKDDSRPPMTREEYGRLAAEAHKLGCLHFNLQGGEPLLLPELEELIAVFRPERCHVSITTNGFLFTKERATRLKNAGIRQVVLSLDDLEPAGHDRFRHLEGAHEHALRAIGLAREVGLAVSVNVTVSHPSLNSRKQKELFEWLRRERIPFNPILACAVGAWAGQSQVRVTEADVAFLRELGDADGLAQRDIDASWGKRGCAAALEQLYLTPYGDLIPCPFIHISLGNVREKPLKEIWQHALTEGLHGHYHPRCWVAEEEDFARALDQEVSPQARLPLSAGEAAWSVLRKFWKK